MIKKIHFFTLAVFAALTINSQTNQNQSTCGTAAPSQQWEDWFSKEVEKFKANLATGKAQMVNHTIPVIVHVIHFGEAVGTYPNIDSNQVKSQIAVLNQDFGGTGFNVNHVPAAFSNLVANTGITFCMATKNPQGGVLTERGIHRVNAQTNLWPNPNTPTLTIEYYINTFVKPSTIWDPLRYLNIWISDRNPAEFKNGFATYPAGTSLNGLFGSNFGTANNDGVWVWTKAFGTVGTLQGPYDKGRTATHEIGHWLGLRHIWGDGNCMSDYCNDTPWAKQENTGCPPVPAYIDRCGIGQSSFGEMTMNFMDGTSDTCKYMFTHNQNVRIQTAMSQCNYRNALGTHNLCPPSTASAVAAFASFNINNPTCIGTPFTPFNTSMGNPAPTFIWSSSPPVAFNPAPSVANPAITMSTPGNYTLTLIATNSLSSSTFTMAINSVTTCPFVSTCIDTLKMIKNTDTLITYAANNNSLVLGCQSGFAGFLTGTNCYKDKEFAEFFAPSTYTATSSPQVNSVIILFDSLGTKNGSGNGAVQITCRIYGGNNTAGPGAQIGAKNDSLLKIMASPKTTTLGYIGMPGYVTPTKIIPYKFNFASPVIINSPSGFFASVETPYFSPGDSIRIFSNKKALTSLDSNAWFLQYSGNWKTMRTFRQAKIQLGIIPIITCSPIAGLNESTSSFKSNVNVVPNPSDGIFNLIFTLQKEENISIKIYNAIGKEISHTQLDHVRSEYLNLDLSHEANGIYFTEISNGNEKIVKKIIINH